MEVIQVIIECFLTGLFSGLTMWGLARVGMLPVLGLMIVKEEENNNGE